MQSRRARRACCEIVSGLRRLRKGERPGKALQRVRGAEVWWGVGRVVGGLPVGEGCEAGELLDDGRGEGGDGRRAPLLEARQVRWEEVGLGFLAAGGTHGLPVVDAAAPSRHRVASWGVGVEAAGRRGTRCGSLATAGRTLMER